MASPLASLLLIAGILSANQFAADVARSGPKPAVQHLVDGGDWGRVMAAIRSGSADWIALAPDLARGADGPRSSELTVALAAALPVAPSDVLAIVDLRRSPVLGVQAVCGAPVGSHAPADHAAYVADAKDAVGLLPDVAAAGKAKAQCLKELAQAR
ncbi:MAG: hypothetical protein WCO11_02215 [Sphingomonadales bacterium]|jgi:hypothetical protein